MLAVAFDTLKLARKLENAGFPPRQAQDVSAALAETVPEWQASTNLATQDDVRKAKEEVQEDVKNLRDEVHQIELSLHSKISDTKNDMIKWFVGISITQGVAVITLLRFLHS